MTTLPFTGFDIETRPQPHDQLALLKPDFKAPSNYTKPEAIARFIGEKEENWYADAALSPFTGAIVMIGLINEESTVDFIEGDEATILSRFWAMYTKHGESRRFVFWSGCGGARKFDIDFIVTRSRILGVPVPPQVRRGRYYSDRIVDLAAELLNHQPDAYMRLTVAAQVMGLYREGGSITPKQDTDLVTGANFWQWYDGAISLPAGAGLTDVDMAKTPREYALRYLRNDLLHLVPLANRIL